MKTIKSIKLVSYVLATSFLLLVSTSMAAPSTAPQGQTLSYTDHSDHAQTHPTSHRTHMHYTHSSHS